MSSSFWSKPEDLEPPQSAPLWRNPFDGGFVPDWLGPAEQHKRLSHPYDDMPVDVVLERERQAYRDSIQPVGATPAPPPFVPPSTPAPPSERSLRAVDRHARLLELLRGTQRGISSTEFARELNVSATCITNDIIDLRKAGHVIIGRRRIGYVLADAGAAPPAPAPVKTEAPTSRAVRVAKPKEEPHAMTYQEAVALRNRAVIERQPVETEQLELAVSVIAAYRESVKREMSGRGA